MKRFTLIFLSFILTVILTSKSMLLASEVISDPELKNGVTFENIKKQSQGSVNDMLIFSQADEVYDKAGHRYKLVSLNPKVNSWFLLEVQKQGKRAEIYHLENSDPSRWQLSLLIVDDFVSLEAMAPDGMTFECKPWDGELERAGKLELPFVEICNQILSVRNKVVGNKTTKEAVSDFLRDKIVFGDAIVNLIKGAFYQDAFMVTTDTVIALNSSNNKNFLPSAKTGYVSQMRSDLSFEIINNQNEMIAGSWYEVKNAPGVYFSQIQPKMIRDDILRSNGANQLDSIEKNADVYLFGFDLSKFALGYSLGTDHPRLGWSSRPSDRHAGSGPDGFNKSDPIIRNGALNPKLLPKVVASFTGGFKREHGAWRFGDKATYNYGNHYGFIQNGVTLSRLWPGLATLYVDTNDDVKMETWVPKDYQAYQSIKFARQNGVPLLENGKPGDAVMSWGDGNWSGSADADLRTVRAGSCLLQEGQKKYLVYAYFSSATPSSMARVFQAYQCNYAMLLDMNSQDLTYSAIYLKEDDNLSAKHIVKGMINSDIKHRNGDRIPRFIFAPDNRDFFYLTKKEE